MPIIKSAKKKLKQDLKKTQRNKKKEIDFKKKLKSLDKDLAAKKANLSKIFSLVDKAVANKLIHKNKAARMKSQYAHKVSKKST